jgi:hypothetical protein
LPVLQRIGRASSGSCGGWQLQDPETQTRKLQQTTGQPWRVSDNCFLHIDVRIECCFRLDRTATDRPAFPADRPAPLLAAPHSSPTLLYWRPLINHRQDCSWLQLPQLCWPQQQQHSTQQQTPLLASAAQHEQCWCVSLDRNYQEAAAAD